MTKNNRKRSNARAASNSSALNPLAESFKALTINMSSSTSVNTTARRRNIVREFNRYFGEQTKLENWQRLCRDVGINEELPSINKCKQALKKVWVNIYDSIDAVNANSTPPQRFPNQAALSAYTIDEHKIYPKKKAKESGPVRALLIHLFR